MIKDRSNIVRFSTVLLTFCLAFFLTGPDLFAQQTDRPFTASLRVTAKVYEDSVVLRWAPDKPGAWLKAKTTGFMVERNEITDKKVNDTLVVIDTASVVNLTEEPIKPWPLEEWQPLVEDKSIGDIAAVAAQVLYGDNNVLGANWIDRADNLTNQFTFALMAADFSHRVADAAGLRFVDRNIERSKNYVYRISSLVDRSEYYIQPGYVNVNSDNISRPVPAPVFKEVEELENTIHLKWDRRVHSTRFTAYYIERSTQPDTGFQRLVQLPYTNPVSKDLESPPQDIVYIDSLQQNYVPYYYRIIGITPFGELSPPSEVIKAMGRDRTPPPQPANLQSEMIDSSSIKLTWEMPSMPPDMDGFYIGTSNNSNEGFVPLFDEPLPADTRSYIDTTINQYVNRFYVVGAVDTAGNGSLSFAEYGKMVDSLAPAPPKNLTGRVDSTGKVHLSWDSGKEPDILGYQVYYAHDPSHDFTQATRGPWSETAFTDTISIKTLTEKIYYKVMAVDWVHNYSEFSEIIELKKPDIIPPTTPVFSNYEVSEEGIKIEWIPSSSNDVVRHELLKRSGAGDWQFLAAIKSDTVSPGYLDELVEADSIYSYTLQAVDDDSNRSKQATPLRLRMIDFSKKPAVDSLVTSIDKQEQSIILNWEYPYPGEYRFVIYRAVNGSDFVSYESVDKATKRFIDHNVQFDNTYEYTIRVFYGDGKKSAFGRIASVELQ